MKLMFVQSAEMYIELGKFGIPAKHHEAIAMIYFKVRIHKNPFLQPFKSHRKKQLKDSLTNFMFF